MIPYFKVKPDEFDEWKTRAEALYKAAEKSKDLLAYNMGFIEGGVRVRLTYRNANGLLQYLHNADIPMQKALQKSTLDKVEVHGTQLQIVRIKKRMSAIGNCKFHFYKSHPKLESIRRPTSHSGNDKMINVDVCVDVPGDKMKSLGPKLQNVKTQARDNSGNESLSFTYCKDESKVCIMGTYENAAAASGEWLNIQAYLGVEFWSSATTRVSGGKDDVQKMKTCLAKDGEESKKHVAATAKKTSELHKAETVFSAAASQMATSAASAGMHESNIARCEGLKDVQECAEEEAKKVYECAMKVEGTKEEEAKCYMEEAYKYAMKYSSRMRSKCVEATISGYSLVREEGKYHEEAVEEATKRCKDAAQEVCTMAQELCEEKEEEYKKAKEASQEVMTSTVKKAEQEYLKTKMSLAICKKNLELTVSKESIKARAALVSMWDDIKKTAEEKVTQAESKFYAAEKEFIKTVNERCTAVCWAVVTSGQEAFCSAYQMALAEKKSAEDAVDCAKAKVDVALKKACAIHIRIEEAALAAKCYAEETMKQSVKAVEAFWDKCEEAQVEFRFSIRCSLYSGAEAVECQVKEVACGIAFYAGEVLDEMEEEATETKTAIYCRITGWYNDMIAAKVAGLRAVADAADAKADSLEASKTQKGDACCC